MTVTKAELEQINRQTARHDFASQSRERNAAKPEPTPAAETHRVQQAFSEADKTVFGSVGDYIKTLSRVVEKEPQRGIEAEPER